MKHVIQTVKNLLEEVDYYLRTIATKANSMSESISAIDFGNGLNVARLYNDIMELRNVARELKAEVDIVVDNIERALDLLHVALKIMARRGEQ